MKPSPRNIALDLILTILLCGFWNIVVQIKQMEALNYLLKTEKYRFWRSYLFVLLSCGIYLIYHEYQKARDLAKLSGTPEDADSILAVLLTMTGFGFVFDAIVQEKINSLLAAENPLF